MRFFLILLFAFNGAFAQSYYKGLTLNSYKVTVNYPDHTVTAYLKPSKENFTPQSDKYYYWYSANQIKATQGGFSGTLLNGAYTDYYRDKNLKEKGDFSSGLKTGEWSAWYENGNLKERINWSEGEQNGLFFRYDTTGKLIERGKYRKGLLNGKLTRYTGKDSVTVAYYRKGKTYIPKKPVSALFKKLHSKKRTENDHKDKLKKVSGKEDKKGTLN